MYAYRTRIQTQVQLLLRVNPHPLLSHPRASELMECIEQWITQEALGQPAFKHLDRLREIASEMLEAS